MSEAATLTKRQIAGLKKKYPLPKGVSDAEMNLSQIAQFMVTSEVTVRKWLTQGMPHVKKPGSKNKEWVFSGHAVFAWRRSLEAIETVKEEKAREAIQAMRLELTGGEIGDSLDGLTPKEKREVITTQMEHERFAESRNELLRRDDVREALEEIFSMVRDSLSSLPDAVHREARLDNHQIEKLCAICDRTLEETQVRIERFFESRPKYKNNPARELDLN